jgi:hypothetical protein
MFKGAPCSRSAGARSSWTDGELVRLFEKLSAPVLRRREIPITAERLEESAARSRQIASEKASWRYRRWSNLSLIKDVLVAVALLAGIGAVLSLGSSGLDLAALR